MPSRRRSPKAKSKVKAKLRGGETGQPDPAHVESGLYEIVSSLVNTQTKLIEGMCNLENMTELGGFFNREQGSNLALTVISDDPGKLGNRPVYPKTMDIVNWHTHPLSNAKQFEGRKKLRPNPPVWFPSSTDLETILRAAMHYGSAVESVVLSSPHAVIYTIEEDDADRLSKGNRQEIVEKALQSLHKEVFATVFSEDNAEVDANLMFEDMMSRELPFIKISIL
jgi:hypothetical protein